MGTINEIMYSIYDTKLTFFSTSIKLVLGDTNEKQFFRELFVLNGTLNNISLFEITIIILYFMNCFYLYLKPW